ncbi:MAG TPA: penicillin acylase family protein [Acetobacteraceae bacterium]|nr:penicillin acylase family protein [Acetobacteraceae bacterium]
MTLRGRGVRALLLATSVGLAAGGARAATSSGTILWDQYAVPHIYGPDIPTVVRGLGYAQMENHAETLLNNVARARGRSAEYFGPGPNNFNLNYDIRVRTYGIPARAQAWVSQGGSFQLSVLQAFCDGVNEYAADHPSDILPALQPILPVVPSDITAGELNTINWTFEVEQDNVPNEIAAWLAGGTQAVKKLQPVSRETGSNGWGIERKKSADGNPILMGNPHLPWGVNQPIDDSDANQNFGVYQWIEANLVIGNPSSPSLNASGVTFIGGPFIGIGFNDYLGWTHTNNTIQNADLYQLTLDSTGTNYLFGGSYLPLQHTISTIKILQPNGTYTQQAIDIYNSIQGPVVAFNTAHTQALALRVAGLNQPSLVTQYWDMIQATTFKQFSAAESMLQMPFFNTMYADRNHVFYLFGGQQPVRSGGTWSDYFGTILDGTDPTKLWTQTFTFSQLPQVEDPSGGWVGNSNNPPWTSAIPQPAGLNPANYPAYVAPNLMDFRPQHGATFLTTPGKFTTSQVQAAKMSTEMYLADRIVGDLIGFANAAANGGDATAGKAAAILSAWDHTADQDSSGGVLFEQWWNNVVADIEAGKITPDQSLAFNSPHPKFVVPWEASAPLTTPQGLDPVNETQLVVDLDSAYNIVAAEFPTLGGAAVKWGDAHKTTLVFRSGATQELSGIAANAPLSGADDPFGPLRVVNPVYVQSFGEFISYGGDGYVQVIEFGPNGSSGGTLLTYGNASRPNSPHIADQVPLFEAKMLKPALRTYSAVQAATVSSETY